jgi:NADP-dependent 3-hydroxy acid dehydrogenase YdfG
MQIKAISSECQRVVDDCVNTWGSVDVLVNCEGICINIEDVKQCNRKEWDKMVTVNLKIDSRINSQAYIYFPSLLEGTIKTVSNALN